MPSFIANAFMSACLSVFCNGDINGSGLPFFQHAPITVNLILPPESIIESSRGGLHGASICPPPAVANKEEGGCSKEGEVVSPFFFRDREAYTPNDVRPVTPAEYVRKKLGSRARLVNIQEVKDNRGNSGFYITATVPPEY